MPDIHRGTHPVGLIAIHLDLGAFIIAVMIVRVLWRLLRKEPGLSEGTAFTRAVAYLTHACSICSDRPAVDGLGQRIVARLEGHAAGANLPSLVPTGSSLGHSLGDVHGLLAWVMLGLIGLHVVAGLYHHFVLRDGVLRRMA